MDGIFISYRREDSAGYAGRLYDRLAAHFGSERVFMDVEGIDPGTDFVEAIERAVTSCKVLIVLIGKEWMTLTDAGGRRRLDDPHDFIRLETGTALKRDIRVVPVLVEGAQMPRADELPDELVSLSRRQAIEINHKQWEASTGNLIEALDRLYQPQPAGAGSPAAPSGMVASGTVHRHRFRGLLGVTLVAVMLGAGWLASQWLLPFREPVVVGPGVPLTRLAEESQDVPSDTAAARESVPSDNPDHGQPSGSVIASVDGTGLNKKDATRRLAGVQLGAHEEPEPPGEVETAEPESRLQGMLPETLPTINTPAKKPQPEPATDAEAEGKTTPVLKMPAPAPIVKPPPSPRILEFSARVSGTQVELCYRVADAKRLILSPEPGRLQNLRADCLNLPLTTQTRFRLLASSGDQRVAESLLAMPEPAPEPKPLTRGPEPVVGDYWTYRITGRWASSEKRTIRISAVATDPTMVEEAQLRIDGERQQPLGQQQIVGAMARVVRSRGLGTEFSPYLGAYGGVEMSASWRNIPTPDTNSFWRDWFSNGEVKGPASIQVPAGGFDTTEVEVVSSRTPSGSPAEREVEPVRINYRVWYAPDVKRYVKMVRTTRAASGQMMDIDTFELVDYRQE